MESSELDNQNDWKADRIILHELLKDMLSLGNDHSLPVEDELTRGIADVFFRSIPVHLWVVFGLQVFLDTQYILGIATRSCIVLTELTITLGAEVTRPFREFRASSKFLRSAIEDHIRYAEVINKKHFDPTENDDYREESVKLHKWTPDDFIMQLRNGHPELGSGRPFFFMSHNLVLCGLLQCQVLLASQKRGISEMNDLRYAMTAAHLYNAAMKEGHLQNHWPDMDKLIGFFGDTDIFLGAPPETIIAYKTQHEIASGVSLTSYAPDKKKPVVLKKDDRRLLKVPQITETLDEILAQRDATKTKMNVDLVEKFLHQTAHRQATRKNGLPHILKPVQLLALLDSCMEEEEARLVFDYHNLQSTCWMLLFAVYSELRVEFTACLPEEKHEDNPNLLLHLLPLFIFGVLVEQVEQVKKAKKSREKGPRVETILSRVARVMDQYISGIEIQARRLSVWSMRMVWRPRLTMARKTANVFIGECVTD